MDEDKVRELLGRYRPAGPARDLRQRALTAGVSAPRTWPWAAAAAALLVVSVGLHVAASYEVPRYAVDDNGSDSVEALAAALGGDADARVAAEMIVAARQWRRAVEESAATEIREELRREY
jgi:hypothetical protein